MGMVRYLRLPSIVLMMRCYPKGGCGEKGEGGKDMSPGRKGGAWRIIPGAVPSCLKT